MRQDSGFENAALLVLGHGSTKSEVSSRPIWDVSARIRNRGVFRSVHCAFWKEEPGLRQIYPAIEEEMIYAVPYLISEGYFTREVLPRELQLDGPVTCVAGKTVSYCDPVGIHPSMAQLLRRRALEQIGSSAAPEDTALIIAGHGTERNGQSREAVAVQVERIRKEEGKQDGGAFAEIRGAYMEEAPFISEWAELTAAPNVVVVPFFIGDGPHSRVEIPRLMGIAEQCEPFRSESVFRSDPFRAKGRFLYYGRAIGSDHSMDQVLLDQVMALHNSIG